MDYRDIQERAKKGRSLQHALALDESVGKRGVPSLPRVRFLEGPGPERYDEQSPRPA